MRLTGCESVSGCDLGVRMRRRSVSDEVISLQMSRSTAGASTRRGVRTMPEVQVLLLQSPETSAPSRNEWLRSVHLLPTLVYIKKELAYEGGWMAVLSLTISSSHQQCWLGGDADITT